MTIRLALQQILARALRRLFCSPIQALQIEQHQQIHTLRRAKNFPHYSDKDPRVAEPQYFREELAIANLLGHADEQQLCLTHEVLTATDIEREKYLDQKRLYCYPILRQTGLYGHPKKPVLWSEGWC